MPFESDPNQDTVASRRMKVLLLVVITAALAGFVAGIRQDRGSSYQSPAAGSVSTGRVIPAKTYGEFNQRQFGPNRDWHNLLTQVRGWNEPAPDDWWYIPGLREVRLERREQRRAFDGAPPTVPHPIEQISTAECLACHTKTRYVGKHVYAPAMSHELMPNCTQCHIEQEAAAFDGVEFVDNTFQGTVRPGRGSRAWSRAPPNVPHSLVLRDNCLSCHGPAGGHAIRTDHPWDAVCLQCHTPGVAKDVRVQFGRPELLRRLGMYERDPEYMSEGP